MEEYKTCNKCKQVLALNTFGKSRVTRSGYGAVCKACLNARAKEYSKQNPEKRLAKEHRYHAKNPGKRKELWNAYYASNKDQLLAKQKQAALDNVGATRAKYRKYRLANKDAIVQKNKEYRHKNPSMHRAALQRRRAKITDSGLYLITTKEISRLYSSSCFYCGSAERITLDHVVPISRGGRHSVGNIVPACLSCNSSKNAKFITEWKKL